MLDKKGIMDKLEDKFVGLIAKISKKNRPLEETVEGGHEVSDDIEEAQTLPEGSAENKTEE